MTNTLFPECEKVTSRQEFSEFIARLRDDLREKPERWENTTLEAYLDSLAAYAIAIQSAYRNAGIEFSDEPTWKLLAQIMAGAAVYE
jgi:cytochrome c-type biogenesis protein CcmH/NrfG